MEQEKKKGGKFGLGFLAGFLAAVLVCGIIFGDNLSFGTGGKTSTTSSSETKFDSKSSTSKLSKIVKIIKENYYQDVDDEALIEGIYDGVVASLGDPYSDYYTEEEYKEILVSITGEFGGIGATLQKDEETGYIKVIKVQKDSPAEECGVQIGDLITEADGIDLYQVELDEAVSHIRGEKGTKVDLILYRSGEKIQVTAKRDIIHMDSVSYEMLDNNIGYIQISSFQEATCSDFINAIEDLKSQGMKAVIYDLRSDTGGLLTAVTPMLDYILPEGTTVYMETKAGERTTYSSDAEHYLDIPTVVLVDEYTASASEIFTGAIRDYNYGTIIGTKTYGKGIVQTTMPVGDGSMLKLTTATYYTPSGTCIHGEGIEPDIELEYEFLGGEDDVYAIEFDNQIQKAIQLLSE